MVVRWTEQDTPRPGLRLHVRRLLAEPPARPVLLLHGLGVTGAVWQSFARRLLPHLAAVAPDLRGHGQSEAPPGASYMLADYANDLVELTSGELPTPVVGHSLGALVAVALADQQPERVAWLVLIDPPLDAQRRNPDVPRVAELRRGPSGALEDYLLANDSRSGRLLAESLARMFRQASDHAFQAQLSAPAGSPETWERAARLRQPCLVIQAEPERGGVLGDAASQEFVARLRAGRRVKIVGSHALHASAPGEVARAILDFGGYSSEVSSTSTSTSPSTSASASPSADSR